MALQFHLGVRWRRHRHHSVARALVPSCMAQFSQRGLHGAEGYRQERPFPTMLSLLLLGPGAAGG